MLSNGVSRGGVNGFLAEANLWRRGWDLNPRYPLRYVRFRGGSFQPLTHLSGKQLSAVSYQSSVEADSSAPAFARGRNDKVWRTTDDQRLTTVFKERLQQFRAATGEYSAAHIHPVIQLWMI